MSLFGEDNVFLDEFHSVKDGRILVSAEQASRFAKEIAGDFNPIHDAYAKRFCVPGDLLFYLILNKYGLSQNMSVTFSDMLGRDVPLILPEKDDGILELKDDAGKVYTHVEHSGESTHDEALVSTIARKYVEFSGHNFPYIMVPLMEKHGVMFNPKRPLVIYESMSFSLDRLDIKQPELALADSTLDVNGKRADAHLLFDIKDGNEVVGKGDKKILVAGLIPFDMGALDDLVNRFKEAKQAFDIA